MMRVGCPALLGLAVGTGCGTGSAAAPARGAGTGPGPYDATAISADAAASDSSDDDESSTRGPYEGGLAWDGCAATGTCPLPAAQVLASGQETPAGITVDATSVYWVNLGAAAPEGGPRAGAQIVKCAKTGCGDSPTVLAAGSWEGMSKLGVDGSNVYWLVTGQVLSCPLAGCSGSPTVVWSGSGALYDIAVDATGVYFTAPSLSQALVCPAGGCDGGATPLWPWPDAALPSPGAPGAIAVDATRVYFSVGFDIFACDKTSCGTTMHLVGTAPGGGKLARIDVDDANVYATDDESFATGRILGGAKGGVDQQLAVLVSGLTLPTGLATDGTSVYFTEQGEREAGLSGFGRVAACPAAGCGNRATVIAGFVNSPLGVAVDTRSVYWTDFGPGTDPTQSDAGRVMLRAR